MLEGFFEREKGGGNLFSKKEQFYKNIEAKKIKNKVKNNPERILLVLKNNSRTRTKTGHMK